MGSKYLHPHIALIPIFFSKPGWVFFFFNVYSFFKRERERDRARPGEGQRERETQNPKQAPGSAISTEPDVRLELMNCKIMT